MKNEQPQPAVADFLSGKSSYTLSLFDHFIARFNALGPIALHPTKSMIGIGAPDKRIAWITQLGKNFIHIVFPFSELYEDNTCFIKIAQVPGDANQFNHHFRMLFKEDVNDEVIGFMKKALLL